jgi:hypothetical protein
VHAGSRLKSTMCGKVLSYMGDVPRVVENGEAGAAIVRLRSFSMLSSRCLMFSRGEL